jgi:hypothetical protein
MRVMLVGLLLLVVVTPAAANWQDEQFIEVYMIQSITAPDVPGANRLHVSAYASWDGR